MKKYYKVYSNCCRVPKSVKEISKEEAYNLIVDAVYSEENTDCYDPFNRVDWDDDNTVNEAYEEVCDKAIEYFEENEIFECGDYAVIKSEEYPDRANSYGNSTARLY